MRLLKRHSPQPRSQGSAAPLDEVLFESFASLLAPQTVPVASDLEIDAITGVAPATLPPPSEVALALMLVILPPLTLFNSSGVRLLYQAVHLLFIVFTFLCAHFEFPFWFLLLIFLLPL